LWETVAEARQLRSLLPGLGSSALGVIAKLGKQRFQSAAGFYLAARYGLMPIISDTENVLKALEKTIGKIRNKVKCENMVSAEAASLITGCMTIFARATALLRPTRSTLSA
jgi:hypothetical protein